MIPDSLQKQIGNSRISDMTATTGSSGDDKPAGEDHVDRLAIPGARPPKFSTGCGSDEEVRCCTTVAYNGNGVRFEGMDPEMIPPSISGSQRTIYIEDDPNRETWDNKAQFIFGVISYAVGLGNVWRFPYLLQKNGGGAFLIPYLIMMVLQGIPLFLIELGIGQRLRTGSVGVWNAIHPCLGGLGISAAIVSYFVGAYYNVIIAWCMYYLYNSFSLTLPWENCPMLENGTIHEECKKSPSTSAFYWNRIALNSSGSISDIDGLVYHQLIFLCLGWLLVYLCVNKGIKSSGKVMYVTATFPYVVTTIFLVRSSMLEGAGEGLAHMFRFDGSKLLQPSVWLDAATQVFYSMGLGFGGLIAFGSYNNPKNNCKRDALVLALANVATSLYTAFTIFCVLGFMAHRTMSECIEKDMHIMADVYNDQFKSFDDVKAALSYDQYKELITDKFSTNYKKMVFYSKMCDYDQILAEQAEGTGLAFIVFTEAILHFPFPPIWSILFFLMLLSLGLGSMFGTLEGVITSLNDLKIITCPKPLLTGSLCLLGFFIGLIFVTRAGQYWVSLFDQFAGSYALMVVAFLEIIAVAYIYGHDRFCLDIEEMTGQKPSAYWTLCWRYFSPALMSFLFVGSIIQSCVNPIRYFAYDAEQAMNVYTSYPTWAFFAAVIIVGASTAPLILVWFCRFFKIVKYEPDIPAASKCLNQTTSTTYMLKSDQSFNRITESAISVADAASREPLRSNNNTNLGPSNEQ
ncbi:hypothetical protein WR25_12702 [Diploscapter pachys]|uniref:Transporter n=1 Tax=Diploscapter pachys TaxID=2018661 RepID=A0A2A2LM26_9BILA|nr:hypothetical protein WR25_12702 [Diploscapter pachys]